MAKPSLLKHKIPPNEVGFCVLALLYCHAEIAVKRERRQACLGLSYCHAELVSASHREPFLVLLRGQILKFAIKREQSQACLNYAEREQIEQS